MEGGWKGGWSEENGQEAQRFWSFEAEQNSETRVSFNCQAGSFLLSHRKCDAEVCPLSREDLDNGSARAARTPVVESFGQRQKLFQLFGKRGELLENSSSQKNLNLQTSTNWCKLVDVYKVCFSLFFSQKETCP